MKKKNASMIIMLVLLVSLSHALITLPESVRATTLYVGGAGPGNYTTIQSAIDAASPGDTIYVFNGTYHEHVIVNKPLSLIGEDRDRTIVDGSGSGDVVNVTVDWVNITGFVVTNSGQEGGDAGIELHHVQNCYISYNVISRNDWGIFLDSSTNNSISNNTASYNRGGITLFSSYKNNLFNNTLSPDNANGIFLYDSENNTITSNTFSNNGYGIYFWAARDNMVANNNVYSSIGTGIYLFSSSGNTIFHNNIVDNARQARNSEINTWDNGYPSGGNYWSDYTGSDQFSGPNQDIAGSDDIGDTSYIIDTDGEDKYPLMFPYGMGPPQPPMLFRATLSGKEMENVTLTWALSSDDGTGFKSVVGYEIYRNTTYHPDGLGYSLFAFLVNGTTEFIDVSAGEGDPNNYFYRLCALDVNDNSTCALNQTAKFTQRLSRGLNLISVPLVQSDEIIEIVLQTVSFDRVWFYDSLSEEWKTFMRSKPYLGNLQHLNHSMGLWVNATEDSNLTVAGIVPLVTTIHLKADWNLVGLPYFKEKLTVSDLKATVPIERVEGFDSSAPPYFLRILQDSDVLLAGKGYWLELPEETILTLSNT